MIRVTIKKAKKIKLYKEAAGRKWSDLALEEKLNVIADKLGLLDKDGIIK